MTVDLHPTARTVARLVTAIPDEALAGPTPCPEYTVADLLVHVGGLSQAFRLAATKDNDGDVPPAPDGADLGEGWRDRIGMDLRAVALAWAEPDAWTGMTRAGGVDLPGEVAGLVALDELVVHGWDLARATGQPYEVDPAALDAIQAFLAPMADGDGTPGLFGPPVPVPADAPLLDRTLGLAGRDPAWSPTRA
ncbi:TIGR03086 family protein [Aquihabitans sp. G128]|uniref:TIGR03086 family metal-binding protein n=1 Tax=Aquihabitans sp. G128 TaxID=2849779 RepID=UPI001C249192|nr:TIGR03086 family metal-binding protein [Aquihabitans sp. G128]QXC61402.1 TIGR03086 family protein [Aquihabitans sp. G128]